ncbi:hypothetical protein HOD29_05955 [archaeon]|jgi:2-phosphoglycerate kinase|nr:hypothetical protein [archaeon]
MKSKTFFIVGAEGVGKSSILETLNDRFKEVEFHDFDDVGVPENPTLQWRLNTTLHWIKKSIENQEKEITTCVLGLSFPKEVMSFEEFNKLENVSFCLLDVNEEERERRLIKRNASRDVIDDVENLLELRRQIKEINGKIIDTSKLSIEETFEEVVNFIGGEMK